MDYNITLPAFAPHAVERHRVHAAAYVYSTLTLHHKWLMNALNKGTYPTFMGVDSEGMITGYSANREPAIRMIRRETLNVARDYYDLLIREGEQLAMYDYIASIDSIQL